MKRIWLTALMVCLPDLVMSQTVTVRGGEHEEFTRLVLDLPRRVDWVVDEGEDLTVELPNLTASFDVSSALTKLSAGRILAVESVRGRSAISVDLNCDCEIQTFLAGDKMLVIDVYGTPRTSETETVESVQSDDIDEEPSSDKLEPSFRLPLIVNDRSLTQPGGRTDVQSQFQVTESQIARAERSHDAELKLLEQMSRSASQGLLQPHLSIPKSETERAIPVGENKRAAADLEPESEPARQNIRAISSIDQAFSDPHQNLVFDRDGRRCMTDQDLALWEWVSDEGFGKHIGELRSQMFGEFDKPNPAAMITLAKAFIGYGMGMEAKQLLRATQTGERIDYLIALADIVEDGEVGGAVPESWLPDCDSAAALWALLAGRTISHNSPLNEAAITRSFSALPSHLRAHIAPFVAERLQAAGKSNLLSDIARLADRGQTGDLTNVALVSAQAEMATGTSERVIAELDKVVRSNGESAPGALVQKIDVLIESGEPVSQEDAELATAFALEYRKDDLGGDLERVALLSRVSAGEFEGSLSALDALALRLEAEELKPSAGYILKSLAQNADDLSFLINVFAPSVETLKFPNDAEHAAAKRLLDLGFPERSLLFLSSAARGKFGRERKLLRAQAALQMGRPRQVEAELLGLHGQDVEEIRIQARIVQGDHRGAQISFSTLGDTSFAAEQAWFAQDWQGFEAMATEEWELEQALVGVDTIEKPARTLANSKLLLNETTDLKRLIGSVLERHEVTSAAAR